MDLTLSEDQRLIRAMAREFLEKECPTTLVRAMEEDEIGFPPTLWRQMAGLGWMGLAMPEEQGGAGMSLQDLGILLEEFGRHLVPGPFIPSVVLSGLAIAKFGTAEQKALWLTGVADGSKVLTYAHAEPNGRWDLDGIEMSAKVADDSYALDGTKSLVPYANATDAILVAVRIDDGFGVFIVPAGSNGLAYEKVATVGSDHAFTVRFDGVKVSRDALLGDGSNGERIIEYINNLGAVAKCAEMVGGAQRALEMSLQFAQERRAFDRPIGSFQAIQHRCADMVTDVDGARLITNEATWGLSSGRAGVVDASVAKAWVGEACRRVLFSAHQIHGAIGFTKEHDLQLFTRRQKSAELAFGDGDYHREQVAAGLGLQLRSRSQRTLQGAQNDL